MALERIREERYPKMLLRNYGTKNFWYDRSDWAESSGIFAAIEEHYRVVRRIPAVAEPQSLWTRFYTYGLAEITVLVPRTRP